MGMRGKPQQSNYPVLDIKEMPGKHLIFEGKVWCVGHMIAYDFDRLIQSYVTHWKQMEMLLTGIDRRRWDRFERWWILEELVHAKKLVLYDTQEQAEQAMRSVA